MDSDSLVVDVKVSKESELDVMAYEKSTPQP